MVSAPVVARERGIHITETRKDAQGAFGSYMRLIVTTEAMTRSVAGTIYSDGKPRFIQIKGINLEAEPMRFMLYTTNTDTPGYIGALGTKLGELGVNIATFALGRAQKSGEAIALLGVDEAVAAGGARRDRDAAADPPGQGAAASELRPARPPPALEQPAEQAGRRAAGQHVVGGVGVRAASRASPGAPSSPPANRISSPGRSSVVGRRAARCASPPRTSSSGRRRQRARRGRPGRGARSASVAGRPGARHRVDQARARRACRGSRSRPRAPPRRRPARAGRSAAAAQALSRA